MKCWPLPRSFKGILLGPLSGAALLSIYSPVSGISCSVALLPFRTAGAKLSMDSVVQGVFADHGECLRRQFASFHETD